jgi:hypothetical protein
VSTRLDIEQLLVKNDWMALGESTHYAMRYFRWLPGTASTVREEIHVGFDKAGRVTAWTVWHNKRVAGPDQEAGTRKRLEEFILD